MDDLGGGMLVGGVVVACVFLSLMWGTSGPADYCPAIHENAPDSLAVVQEFPECLEYTRADR